jgi:4-hydroxy-3-methylbut-2-enyl diphosphate reductase
VHLEALRYAQRGLHHRADRAPRHVEVEGTLGEAPETSVLVEIGRRRGDARAAGPTRVAYITQTTLSVDDVRAIVEALKRVTRDPRAGQGRHLLRHPEPPGRGEGAGAPLQRDPGGGRSDQQQRQPAGRGRGAHGARAYLIEAAEDIRREWITGDVGITAGRSTPEDVVQACVARVRGERHYRVEEFRLVEERVMFPLPADLLTAAKDRNVAVGAGNERAAARVSGGEIRIRHH